MMLMLKKNAESGLGNGFVNGAKQVDPANVGLFGIWGASSSDVFAVGSAGTILRGTQ